MDEDTIILFLKLIIFLLLISFSINFVTQAKTDCEMCESKGVNVEQFMEEYFNECIYVPSDKFDISKLVNVSLTK